MKTQKTRVLTMIAGLLLALAVISSHLFTPDHSSLAEKTKTEQTNEDTSETFISTPTITPPAPAHVHINLLAHCLFEITPVLKSDKLVVADDCRTTEKFLLTLFRVIISPNAP